MRQSKQKSANKNSISSKTGTFVNSALDTLAQLPTNTTQVNSEKNFSDTFTTQDTLYKRARAKTMTNAFASKLASRFSPLQKSYKHSLKCAAILSQQNNKITGLYCNQRWCLVCNRIRTAKLINGYLPQLQAMNDKYFVTLTVPNVKAQELSKTVSDFYKNISAINRVIRERRKVKFKALRKFECTYNLERKDFHPHIHMVIDSEYAGLLFIDEWLKRYPTAERVAQDIRKASNDACFELFKYFTKIVSKTYKQNEQGQTEQIITGINTEYLDTIFLSIRGLRTFQPMGIKKVAEDIEDVQAVEDNTRQAQTAFFEWFDTDWIDTATGEVLTNYAPSEAVKHIIDNVY